MARMFESAKDGAWKRTRQFGSQVTTSWTFGAAFGSVIAPQSTDGRMQGPIRSAKAWQALQSAISTKM